MRDDPIERKLVEVRRHGLHRRHVGVAVSPPMPSTQTFRAQMWAFGLTGTGPRSTNAPASMTVLPQRTS